MTLDVTQEEFDRTLARLAEVRRVYLDSVAALSALEGDEFDREAKSIGEWVSSMNAELNDFAREVFNDPLAIDAESLLMHVTERANRRRQDA